MALGGGTFTAQNKILPGSYINFISAARASSALSERGIAALAFELNWGDDTGVFTVSQEQFYRDSLVIFGYSYKSDALKPLRELFGHIREAHLYRVNSGGVKAENTFATAKYCGTRGNDLKIIVEQNENFVTGTNEIYDVTTVLGTAIVDVQYAVSSLANLLDNGFVVWKDAAVITATAGLPMTGGTNGTVIADNYQAFLDAIESYSFNAIGCMSAESTIKALFVEFTKRMRDEIGMKFQCVLHKSATADFEGVVSVENNAAPDLVPWTVGVCAGVAVNESNTNRLYDGEYSVDTAYTQNQLEAALTAGKFIFHKVGAEVRVLEDINTLVTVTEEKGTDFKSNQTVRVLDQIANDIAALFNTKYIGKVPNDADGRISLWNDIVKHHEELQSVRAIENFDPENVTVAEGSTKKAVVVTDYVTPVNAMAQLYMTVYVE